jgi:dCMP deaminase
MKAKFQKLYNNIAHEVAKMSHARRLQVGAVIVKDDRVISMGYNGMPAGWENDCEFKEYLDVPTSGRLTTSEIEEKWPFEEELELVDPDEGFFKTTRRYRLKTRPEVLHAESNAVSKLAKSNDSGDGADIFVTHAPCMECSKLIFQSGIRRVYYSADYRDDSGIKFLKQSGVEVIKQEYL